MEEENTKKNEDVISIKLDPWKTASAVLGIALIISLAFNFLGTPTTSGYIAGGSVLSQTELTQKISSYVEALVQGQAVSVESIEDFSPLLYRITLNIGGNTFESYATKDGNLMFPQAFDLNNIPQPPQQQQAPPPTGKVEVSVDDDPSIGPEDAPVTIIEFSEFQCPFCARVEPTIKQIIETYGDKIRFVYRDFPLSFHQYAQKASEASECADEQGKFWEYHDKLFENQNALDEDSLKEYAEELGLDTEQFNECLDSGKYTEEVEKDFNDGQAAGVSGTPAFFINGRLLSGAQPFSAFKQVIDEELSNE